MTETRKFISVLKPRLIFKNKDIQYCSRFNRSGRFFCFYLLNKQSEYKISQGEHKDTDTVFQR